MAGLEQYLHHLKLSVVTKTSKEKSIGIGSYASVYEVTVHGTLCASKEMHPLLMSETNERAFLSECVHSSRMLHPNIVQFLGIYYPNPEARLPWLVMELMHISLRSLIEKYEKDDFSIHFKLSILMDTCNGLQFLHSQNIIHRDLSSNNILLTKHLVAKISDLGMAKVIPPGLQRHTQAPGTVVFMPPEALSINPQYGKPIDVFSVGCVCVHMISMEWPTPLDKIGTNNVVLSEVQRREQYFTKMIRYPPLQQLVEQCLQDKPEQRPVIEEVIKSLNSVSYDHQAHEDDNIIDLFTSALKCSAQDEQIAQKDQLLIEKDTQLAEKDDQLSKKHQQLEQKDQQLEQKDQQLVQKDQQLVQNNQLLVQKDQQLVEKDQQLKQKDQMLLELSNKANISKVPDEEAKEMLSISAKGLSLNSDVLTLMQKTEAYQKSALSNDLQTATVNVDFDDPFTSFSSSSETSESSKTKAADTPPDAVTSAKGSPDVLSLMQKTEACQQPILSYDHQTATINVDCNGPSTLFSSTSEATKSSVNPKTEAAEDAPPDGVTSAKGSSLNPDVLALMQKTGAYQNSALSYDLQRAAINVDCDDPTEKEKIKEEFYTAYRELTIGGKLKERTFPIDDIQQANTIVDEYSKMFSHIHFRYDPEKKEVKCLSTDARQMQNVRRRLKSIQKAAKVKSVSLNDLPKSRSRRPTIKQGSNSEFIDLPSLDRRVTIKLGDIAQEDVDVIVKNATDVHLLHDSNMISAIDKAGSGVVQAESGKVTCTGKVAPTYTGEAVETAAGGALKCEDIFHAVGPMADHHKNQSAMLLKNACVNAMNQATTIEAISIAFPPISSGSRDVPTDLVANVMLSTLCSYPCSNPTLLSDVRIVIIDKPTFEIFLKVFHREQQKLEQGHNNSTTADVIKPPIYEYSHSQGDTSCLPNSATRSPSHLQPVSFNKGSKEETAFNDFPVTNESTGYKSSVDSVSPSPDEKPTSSNASPSLQPSTRPSNDHNGDKHKGISVINVIVVVIIAIISYWLYNYYF